MKIGIRAVFRGSFLFVAIFMAQSRARAGESWDAIHMNGVKVGYTHLFVEDLKSNGKDYVRVRFNQVLVLRRDHDDSIIQLRYGTIETPEGDVLKLDTRLEQGLVETQVKGVVADGKMRLSIISAGKETMREVDWPADTRGPYAAELSLARSPITAGETRALKSFVPILYKIVVLNLKAVGLEETELGDGSKRELMRVEQKVELPDGTPMPVMDGTFWVDKGGQILKTYVDSDGGQTMYRTTKAAAEKLPPPSARFNIIGHNIIKVASFPNADKSSDVTYRIAVRGEAAEKLFKQDGRQTVKAAGDGKSILLRVRTTDPASGEPGPETVEKEYLESSAMIDAEHPLVVSDMKEAAGDRTDPWQKAVAIEEWVAEHIRDKNFKTTFASAGETARNLEGDCTEHAVLAAAMSRAAGIPARVAVGLVYAPDQKGFGFHMWHEVYVNRRWVALDAAYRQTSVDASHIKVLDSSLSGIAPFETFMPIAALLGKTSIRIVETR